MGKTLKSKYRYCIVPCCTSTTSNSVGKLFFSVPKDPNKRKLWTRAMKRDERKNATLSNKTTHWCCEDHFSLKEDMENFWQWHLTRDVKRRQLKAGVVPHIFACQKRNIKPPIERGAAKKRRHKDLLQETLAALSPAPSTSTFQDLPVQELGDSKRRPQKEYVLKYVHEDVTPSGIEETRDGERIHHIKMEIVEEEDNDNEDQATEDNGEVSGGSDEREKSDPPEAPSQQTTTPYVQIKRNSLINNAAQRLSTATEQDDPIYAPSGRLRLNHKIELKKKNAHLLNNNDKRLRLQPKEDIAVADKTQPSSYRPLTQKSVDPREIEHVHEESVSRSVKKERLPEGHTENAIYSFFKSMADVVATFPPHLIAETRLKVCKLVTETELRAISEQNMMDLSSGSLPVISRVSSVSNNS